MAMEKSSIHATWASGWPLASVPHAATGSAWPCEMVGLSLMSREWLQVSPQSSLRRIAIAGAKGCVASLG